MKLNHIGIVVACIEKESLFYQELGFSVSEILINETQKVKEVFVQQNTEVTLELLEPIDNSSPVYSFLKQKGGGVHHFCYEIDGDIDEFILHKRKQGAVVICKPVEDIAFKGRIAFLYMQGKLIEIVEKQS